MDEAGIDLEDCHDKIVDAYAQANTLIVSRETHAYLSEVTLTDTTSLCQEIVEPITFAQIVTSSNKFHNGWHSAVKKGLRSLTEMHTWTLAPMPMSKKVIGCV